MSDVKGLITFFAVSFTLAFLYMGADWQTEVIIFNLNNGWEPYAWICTAWQISNWAAFDFWRLIRYVIVAYFAAQSFALLLLYERAKEKINTLKNGSCISK